jgi:SAM-dependent methyltransferase
VRVLDAACGVGIYALPLARMGCPVVALDITRPFLEELESKAAGCRNVQVIEADIREFAASPPVDAGRFRTVLSMCSSWGYLRDKDEHVELARNIRGLLEPGGKFLVDIASPRLIRESAALAEFASEDGLTKVERRLRLSGQGWNRRALLWYDVVKGRERTTCSFSVFAFSKTQMRQMFEAAGFETVEQFGDLYGAGCSSDSRRIVTVGTAPTGSG